jgi:PHP family Zn ribbon phosphoesterase
VLGTGDFTHPVWFRELQQKLAPAEDGLYALRERPGGGEFVVPASCGGEVRFMLSAEVSCIYSKNGKTRKVHNVILCPDFESARKINLRLERIGNLCSDGRPILGLDSRNLLEIVLESSEKNILIPAHIWTPHFSVLGAFSAFSSIEECLEELAEHIPAVETGLSSDPPMNWRVKSLDSYTLVSNSDAHSPAKLAREANIFDTGLSYFLIKKALEDPAQGFLGTIEFFPEEGKYHYDGHRACGVRTSPAETAAFGGKCPKCGKKLTLGVLYRSKNLRTRILLDAPFL